MSDLVPVRRLALLVLRRYRGHQSSVALRLSPSQGERERYGYPQTEVGPPHGTNPNRSGSRNVDLPSSAQTLVGQHAHHSPSLEDTASSESHALRERPLPEVPVFPNEGQETAPPDGSHDPLNRQTAPNGVPSFLAADHSVASSFPITEHRPHLLPRLLPHDRIHPVSPQ
ncbi:hypothetical protein EDB86DRAFT_272546 [Lactarius hatsudake]|nr:hypothetical protein EDB86DRAFT_272546 [Lactarius hatsudake]